MYMEQGATKTMYQDWDKLKYFVSSPTVVLESKLMYRLNIDVLVLCAAYRSTSALVCT